MPAPTDYAGQIAELRAAVRVGDERLEIDRKIRTTQITARLAAASPGPWYVHAIQGQAHIYSGDSTLTRNRVANVLRSGRRQHADADLIVHTPADETWLLAELARVRAERDLLLTHADDQTRIAYYAHRAEARQTELRGTRG